MGKVLSGRRIFVAEDEMLVLMDLENMLADLGCESVISAATVGEALVMVESLAIDAGILNVNLRGDQKVFVVAEALAARSVPYIFATGYGRESLIEGYLNRPLLTKPYRLNELADKLTQLLQ